LLAKRTDTAQSTLLEKTAVCFIKRLDFVGKLVRGALCLFMVLPFAALDPTYELYHYWQYRKTA
jgi:hypothetical protein